MQVERRFHPRFNLNLKVTIHIKGLSTVYNAQLINMSLSGAQITVNKETIDSIMAHCKLPIEFELLLLTDIQQIDKLKTRLIVNRRISNQQYDLGLKLLNITTTQHQQLSKLFANL